MRSIIATLILILTTSMVSAQEPTTERTPPPPEGSRKPPDPTGKPDKKEPDADQETRAKSNLLKQINEWTQRNQTILDSKRADTCPYYSDRLTIDISANGTLLCETPKIREGSKISVNLWSSSSWINLYKVNVTKGDARKGSSIVRGSVSDAAAMLKDTKVIASDDLDSGSKPITFGPFGPFEDVDTAKLSIELEAAGISQEYVVRVKHAFPINVGVGLTFSPGYTTYSISDGKIASNDLRRPQNFWVTLEWNLFAWGKVAGKIRNGRYYEHDLDCSLSGLTEVLYCALRRTSAMLGLSVSDPLKKVYIGGSYDVINGVHLTAGALYEYVPTLKSGYSVGDPFTGEKPPLNERRNWTYALGIAFDVDIAKIIVDLLRGK